MTEIEARLLRPVDAASLAAFRIGLGALLLALVLRFFVHGFIAEYFLVPTHFFKYWGFSWVQPWPGLGMYLHFALLGLCALGIALGYRYRASVVGFGVLFAYAHLIDKTNYLNHYYLVMCLCGLGACLPLNAAWSLDARRKPELAFTVLPAWMLWALRAQFGVVYVFGGIAKLNADWLLRGEPLATWLGRSSELPLLGPLLTRPGAALGMSWAGALFDLSIVPLLLWRRSRALAFLAAVSFHALTGRLFQLGMFPYLMLLGLPLFLEPSWPRAVLAWLGLGPARGRAGLDTATPGSPRYALPLLGAYFAFQLLMPLRHLLYPGDARWAEQGFRFAWNVMVMEKTGSLQFRVVEPASGRTFRAAARDYFTPYQTHMMAPQPDMVLEAARIVAADYRARGVQQPAVYVDAFAALNGRPMQRLIDPRVDLASQVDGVLTKSWILPLKTDRDGQASKLARSFE